MKTKLFLLSVLAAFTFTSCEKCKDCHPSYEVINGYDIADADALATLFGHATFDEFFNAQDSITQLNGEYCDDDLTDKEDYSEEEDYNGDGNNDMRFFYDCH